MAHILHASSFPALPTSLFVLQIISPLPQLNLYSGISACTKESHVHVQCDPHFISQVNTGTFFIFLAFADISFHHLVQLFTLAEPELSGLRQERHARTIEIAQNEVNAPTCLLVFLASDSSLLLYL